MGRAEVIKRGFLLQGPTTAVMAALILTVICGHNHLIASGAPFRDKGGQHFVHHETGVVHLLAVMKEPVPHAVQRAGVQHAVVQAKAQAKVGERGKEINVRRRHLIVPAVACHRVKPAMVDRLAVRFVILNVPHEIERGAVEEL